MINWFLYSWGALAMTTFFYLVQLVAYLNVGRVAMAMVFAGYALANLGLIWDFARQSP